MALLALLAALLGATGLAYNVLNNPRVTAVGVLVSFVVLVQFASFLGDLEERSRRADPGVPPSLLRALVSQPRRLVEVLVDFAIICTSFLVSYLLFVDGKGTEVQRAVFLATLPVLLGVRYVFFVVFGIYRRVWRFAAPRDLLAIAAATSPLAPIAIAIVAKTQSLAGFPLEIFVVDVLLCTTLVGASRLALRVAPDLLAATAPAGAQARPARRSRPLGQAARSRAAARRRTTRVVGFLDDNPGVRRRRVLGVKVLGGLDEAEALHRSRTARRGARDDPGRAGADRLDAVVAACAAAGVAVPVRAPPRPRSAIRRSSRSRPSERCLSRSRSRLDRASVRCGRSSSHISCSASLYAWQAWRSETPTLFSDEIEFTQVSRSIADTGKATFRTGFGQPATSVSLLRVPGRAGLVARRRSHRVRR